MQKGYVQVYTGNGKGKTTAMLGQAMRASGAGLKVYIGQFVKSMEYHEVNVIRDLLPNITIELYGHGCTIARDVNEEDILAAKVGIRRIKEVISSGEYDVVMLDEVNIAVYLKLLEVSDVLGVIKTKLENVELVLTGRYAAAEIIEAADLVTEMVEVKHYYSKGVEPRNGVER